MSCKQFICGKLTVSCTSELLPNTQFVKRSQNVLSITLATQEALSQWYFRCPPMSSYHCTYILPVCIVISVASVFALSVQLHTTSFSRASLRPRQPFPFLIPAICPLNVPCQIPVFGFLFLPGSRIWHVWICCKMSLQLP